MDGVETFDIMSSLFNSTYLNDYPDFSMITQIIKFTVHFALVCLEYLLSTNSIEERPFNFLDSLAVLRFP